MLLVITAAPILVMPNINKCFVLEDDASKYGVGAVLSQEGHLMFFSKMLRPKS